jgi:hypothetical protein
MSEESNHRQPRVFAPPATARDRGTNPWLCLCVFVPLCEPTVKIWNQTGPLVMKPRVEAFGAGERTHTKALRHKERNILVDCPRSQQLPLIQKSAVHGCVVFMQESALSGFGLSRAGAPLGKSKRKRNEGDHYNLTKPSPLPEGPNDATTPQSSIHKGLRATRERHTKLCGVARFGCG